MFTRGLRQRRIVGSAMTKRAWDMTVVVILVIVGYSSFQQRKDADAKKPRHKSHVPLGRRLVIGFESRPHCKVAQVGEGPRRYYMPMTVVFCQGYGIYQGFHGGCVTNIESRNRTRPSEQT
jgi:hypothetical protein